MDIKAHIIKTNMNVHGIMIWFGYICFGIGLGYLFDEMISNTNIWSFKRGRLGLIMVDHKTINELSTDYLPHDTSIKLVFDNNFNQPLVPGLIPGSIQSLIFGWNFDQPIGKNVLPEGLKELKFSCNFDQKPKNIFLPKNLTRLIFCTFKYSIDELEIPMTLEHLEIRWDYNRQLLKPLPKNLKYLYLGVQFNQTIQSNILSPNLEELQFGLNFNQPLGLNVLPRNLLKLSFMSFNAHPLEEIILPKTLTDLSLGYAYNKPLTFVPLNLKYLSCNDNVYESFHILCANISSIIEDTKKCFNISLSHQNELYVQYNTCRRVIENHEIDTKINKI